MIGRSEVKLTIVLRSVSLAVLARSSREVNQSWKGTTRSAVFPAEIFVANASWIDDITAFHWIGLGWTRFRAMGGLSSLNATSRMALTTACIGSQDTTFKTSFTIQIVKKRTHPSSTRKRAQSQTGFNEDGNPITRRPSSVRHPSTDLTDPERCSLQPALGEDLYICCRSHEYARRNGRSRARTLSATYFPSPYPLPTATPASSTTSSGNAPLVLSQDCAEATEDVNRNRISSACGPVLAHSIRLRVPRTLESKEERERLKSSLQAL